MNVYILDKSRFMATSVLIRRSSVSLRCNLSLSRCRFASLADSHFKQLTAEEISPKQEYNIAGRKWLPGSQGEGFPKYLNKAKEGFPFACEVLPNNKHSLSDWAKKASQVINKYLPKHGAMVLRGLPLTSNEAIAEFSKALPFKPMSYPSGGAGDKDLHDDEALVYTASNEPPEFTIELHNELGYLPIDPVRKVKYNE